MGLLEEEGVRDECFFEERTTVVSLLEEEGVRDECFFEDVRTIEVGTFDEYLLEETGALDE